jgi:hypothetical protein
MATKSLDELLADLGLLTGDKAQLKAGAKLPENLVAAGNSIAELTARIVALEGDKAKLAAGATLPTDLVTAANSIATLTKERDDAKGQVTKLEGEKKTVDEAVAAKVAALGISDKGGRKAEDVDAGGKKLTATEQVCKAKGVKTYAELLALKK